jgi:hypothetical protein
MNRLLFAIAVSTFHLGMLLSTPAQAKQICGWYVIAFCSPSQAAADDFAGRGWGAAIDTDVFRGFRHGLYCVVSGPQSKVSAIRDRRSAIGDGVSDDAYIKRACADSSDIGD